LYRVGGLYTIGRRVDIPWVGGSIYMGISIPLLMVYRPSYQWYINPLPMVYIKILKYDENFEILWNFWVLKFYIFFLFLKFSNFLKLLNFNFFLENCWCPTDGISTPLPMVYWPPYPWYIDPPKYTWKVWKIPYYLISSYWLLISVYSWLCGPGQWLINLGRWPRSIYHW
jgi:hypothetical protein